jgi:hypothetical protein
VDDTKYAWTSRVSWVGGGSATAYTRNHVFTVGGQASFRETDAHPDAVEYLLGALGGDLISGFASYASRRGVEVEAMEASVSGLLDNPLVYLGVVGERGHPGFETISCTLYVSADADEENLNEIWQTTLARSPLVNTLDRCVGLTLKLHAVG